VDDDLWIYLIQQARGLCAYVATHYAWIVMEPFDIDCMNVMPGLD
jgi:hypothetical protein